MDIVEVRTILTSRPTLVLSYVIRAVNGTCCVKVDIVEVKNCLEKMAHFSVILGDYYS